MSKLLLFSDIHVHTHKQSLNRLQDCLNALEWVFKTAIDRNIKDIVFLGDLFQDREKIQVLPYLRTFEMIEKYAGGNNPKINLYLLVGNHDMWFADKLDVSSVYPLEPIKGVRIIRRCETINIAGLDIDFLPFTLNPPLAISSFKRRSRVLCGHIALDGAKLNAFHAADVSVEYDGDMVKVDSGLFNTWERVFLGHYHGEQRIGNVEYVGSPLQLNFAEAFQEKHIIELDTSTLKTEYIINDFSPKHLIVSEDDIGSHDLNNSFVRLQPKKIAQSDLVDLMQGISEQYQVLSFECMAPKLQDDQETKDMIDGAKDILCNDKDEMLERYLKAVGVPDGLDFETCLKIGKDICQKSMIN